MFTRSQSTAQVTVVRLRERVADVIAATCLVSGAGLFLFARQSLTSLAKGTYLVPVGTSYISRADFHAAQSKLGLWLVASGIAVAVAAAMSHSRARRSDERRGFARVEAN